MSNPEKDLEKTIVDNLEWKHIYCVKVHSGKVKKQYGKFEHWIHLAPKGTPDLFTCYMGRFLCIEVKTPSARAKWDRLVDKFIETGIMPNNENDQRAVEQWQTHERIRASGGLVSVCSSIDELEADLAEIAKLPPLGSNSFPPLSHGAQEQAARQEKGSIQEKVSRRKVGGQKEGNASPHQSGHGRSRRSSGR